MSQPKLRQNISQKIGYFPEHTQTDVLFTDYSSRQLELKTSFIRRISDEFNIKCL